MNNEIKEILEHIQYVIDEDDYWGVTKVTLKPLLDYITNLQQEINKLTAESTEWESKCYDLQQENETLHENNQNMQEEMARTWKKYDDLQQENERLKARLTDTAWQYDNMRIKVEKQYIKGITEELIEDIEICFFNGEEKPDLIPIDSLDICHIFGYIDYLKDYKSRCEKASEELKQAYTDIQNNDNANYIHIAFRNDLLNILQNGSEEK